MAYIKLPTVVDIDSDMVIREVYGPSGSVALRDIRVITRPREYNDPVNPRASYMMADVVCVDGTTRGFGFGYMLDRAPEFYAMVKALNAIIKGEFLTFNTMTQEITRPPEAVVPLSHNLIMYHADCVDGMAAAWVARKWCEDHQQTYDLLPVHYGKQFPQIPTPEGKEIRIHILDFSYPIVTFKQLVEYYNPTAVVYLDHHATAEGDLTDADLWMTMDKNISNDVRFVGHTPGVSGAVMAWYTYFCEEAMPQSIIRVGDRDTWAFNYTDSKDFHAFAGQFLLEPDRWHFVFHDDFYQQNCNDGRAIRGFMDRIADKYSNNDKCRDIEDNGAKGKIVNVQREFVSDTCDLILRKNQDCMFSMAYQCNIDHWKFDLRSPARDGADRYDCGEVARLFGGGGHTGAAGIVIKHTDVKTLKKLQEYFGFTL